MKIFYLTFIAMILCSPACHSAALPSLPCDFYGEGTALNIGSTIEAKDPQGISCGSFFVNSQAKYGFMSVYPDLASTLNIDEGASGNDAITFYLNSALLANTAIWHSGSSVRSDVSAGMEDTNLEAAYQFLYNQMDKYIIPGQENTPRLVESFSSPYPYIPQNPTHPPVLIKEGFVYDNALTMIAFLVRGQADDLRRARLIGEAFVGLVSNDSSHDGRIRDVYYVDLSDPSTFHKPTFYGKGSGSGNLAWVMNALVQYCKREWNQEFFDTALEIANFIESNYRRYDYEVFPTYNDNLHVNAYKNGYIALSDGTLRLEPYVVTEHNVVLHASFMRLYELMKSLNMPGYADWYNRAMVAKDFVTSGPPDGMWRNISPNSQLYLAGTRFQKVLDANTHAIMAFNEVDRNPFILNWIETNLLMTHDGFTGFAYDDTKIIFPSAESGIWFEGTGYMSVVYQMMNDIPSSNFYISQIESSQFNNPSLSNYGAIPTACHSYVDTYFYDLFRSPHIAATASYALAKQGYNVLWTIPSGVNSHPVADAGDNTAAAISEPLSLNGSRSWDPNNDALSFNWQITAKPQGSNAAFIDSDTATPALTPDKQGAYEIQLVVSDYDAQSTPDNVTITVEGSSDSEAPQVSNITPVDGTYTPNKRQFFHADLSDNVELKGAILFSDYPYGFFYPVLDMVLSGNTASIDYTPSSDIEEGWHLYHLYTSDTSDNYTVSAISFIVDSIAPNAANITPLNGAYTTNRRQSFHADVSDNLALKFALLRLDGMETPAGGPLIGGTTASIDYTPAPPYTPTGGLTDGTHTYELWVRDAAENQTESLLSFTVDNTKPQITVIGPAGNSADPRSPFIADVTDNYCLKEAKLAFDVVPSPENGPWVHTEALSGQNARINWSGHTQDLTAGSHFYVLYVWDLAGNMLSVRQDFIQLSGESLWRLNMTAMPWYENTIPYNSTGAATCQMILNYIRGGAGEPLLSQNAIYEYARSPQAFGPDLTTLEVDKALGHFDPYDYLVSNSLDNYDSLPGGNPYQGYNFSALSYNPSTDSEAMNKYMRDISHWMAYQVAKEYMGSELVARPNTPAALPIFGTYSHWIAVKGCVTSVNPAPAPHTTPADLTVYGFWVKDPLSNGIGQDTYKTAAECASTYFLPLVTQDGYNGRLVQVAEPPAELSNANTKIAQPKANLANLAFVAMAKNTSQAMSGSAAQSVSQRSWRDIVDPNLLSDQEAVAAFEGTQAGEPVLVDRIDNGPDYYLVPFGHQSNTGEFLVSAVIILDVTGGYFKEASWTKNPKPLLNVDKAKALNLVMGLRTWGGVTLNAELVWKTGGYSSSLYKPYWKVTGSDGRIWYVTQEGKVISPISPIKTKAVAYY